jgi:hypothetical protein
MGFGGASGLVVVLSEGCLRVARVARPSPCCLTATLSGADRCWPRRDAAATAPPTSAPQAVIVSMGLEWALEQETAKGLEQGLNNESDTTCLVRGPSPPSGSSHASHAETRSVSAAPPQLQKC